MSEARKRSIGTVKGASRPGGARDCASAVPVAAGGPPHRVANGAPGTRRDPGGATEAGNCERRPRGHRYPGRRKLFARCGQTGAGTANPCENRDAPVGRQANQPPMA